MKLLGLCLITSLFLGAVSSYANNEIPLDLDKLHALEANGDYEPAVMAIVDALQSGELEVALEAANAHLVQFPKSQVGHLLKADILNALTGELNVVGASSAIPEEHLEGLKHQLRNRWLHTAQEDDVAHQFFPCLLYTSPSPRDRG